MEEWVHIRHLHAQGLSIHATARETGFSRNTIRTHLRDPSRPRYGPRPPVPGVRAPFENYLKVRPREVPSLTAYRLFREIQDQGFRGSYPTVLRYVRPLREARKVTAVYRYETPPGLQGQVDWAMFSHVEIDGQRTTLAAFLFPRGYSRATYVEFVTDLSTPTFLRCHQNAFDYFGGFPKEILYDNLKSVVLRRAYLAAQSQFHPLFLNFAAYYPFPPRLGHPYRPATKGKVEDWVQFVRKNFFEGRHFSSLQELNHRARLWCNEVHQRVHGTTHVPPIDRLELERLSSMVGRPHCPIVQTFARRISRDCFVRFLSNKYSVPWKYAGREATLRRKGGGFVVEVAGEGICHPTLAPGAHGVIQIAGHRAGLLTAIRRQAQVHQLRRESFPSLPPAPEVQRRDLAVYDTLWEERA